MNKVYKKRWNNTLFGLNYFDDFEDVEEEDRFELASSIVRELGEQNVFDEWFNYLKESIHNQNEAWSFMLWFFNYNGAHFKVKNPYPFLALLFSKLELSLDKDKGDDDYDNILQTFDSIYVELLIGAGIIKVEDYCYVNLFADSKFKEELDAIKQ